MATLAGFSLFFVTCESNGRGRILPQVHNIAADIRMICEDRT